MEYGDKMTYSTDFREKVFEIKEGKNLTYEETAYLFGIGISTLVRWKNGLVPKGTRNRRATKIDPNVLREDVKQYPDSYQYERAERFGVSRSGIWSTLKRLGISSKKKFIASKNQGRCKKNTSKQNRNL